VAGDRKSTDNGPKDAAAAFIRLPPIGFWSYSRQDDELSKGRLSNLRGLLMSEIQQQYGRDRVQLFQDVSAIPHGAAWEREISSSLDNSTFFIPIITPNFIQSEWCCTEVRIFLKREQKLFSDYPDLRRRSRIFPLQLIDITGIDAHDQLVLSALEQLQWFDFRRMRHRNLDDETVQHALSEFAASIRDLLQLKVHRPLTADERKRQEAEAEAEAKAEGEAARRREEAERARAAEERAAEAARVEAGLAAEARRREEEAREQARREALEAERRAENARQAEMRAAAHDEPRAEEYEGAEPAQSAWPSLIAGRSRLWLLAVAAIPLLIFALSSFWGGSGASEAPVPFDTGQANDLATNSVAIPVPSAPSLPPGAVSMQDALAALPASEWASSVDETFFGIERRVTGLGSYADLRALAESGNARAQHLLARALAFGQFGAPQNEAEAIEWHRRAADGGDLRSQYDLGSSYERGQSVGQNHAEAARLYAASAAQGFAKSQYNLGVFYMNGVGVERDYARAMSLFRQAADQNYRFAFSNIAYLYESGMGVDQDYAQAASWARLGANLGESNGQTRLGKLLYEGRGGIPQNQAEGLMWLRRAAAADDAAARTYLTERNLPLQ
jgi:hypothetical protein